MSSPVRLAITANIYTEGDWNMGTVCTLANSVNQPFRKSGESIPISNYLLGVK
jgi:hypothetical protein